MSRVHHSEMTMDQPTRDMIRALAEAHGLDPDELLASVAADDLPEAADAVMDETLRRVGLFARAKQEADNDRND